MKAAAVILFVMILADLSLVWGKTTPDPTKPAVAADAQPQSSDKFKFQGLKLKGQLKKPDLSYIYKRKGIRAEKIVNIPENFNDEIAHDTRKL
jgi:hypothetical protein